MSAPSSRVKRTARRLAKPVTSPIDGRVDDINRRVDTVKIQSDDVRRRLDQLAVAVGDYATAATESTSFVGAELRRLEETLRELNARSVHEYYRAKLAEATERPLAALDGDLASVLNFSSGHRGFAAQAELWFNPPVTVELTEGSARLAGVNERIVELPFAMAALGRLAPPARVLDIGSAESWFPLAAASMGYDVTALDLRPLPYSHPNLTSAAGRFEDWEPPAEAFDAMFLISTVEHVGLGAYGEHAYGGDSPGTGADRELVQRVGSLLSDGGFIALTTPYGTRAVNDFERTYDAEGLAALLEGWTIIERREVFRRDDVTWAPHGDAETGGAGVVMVVATPA